jgi:hypothetical protein
VRLRPPARRFRGVTELRIMDDDWLVQDVDDKKGVRIRNIRTDHVALLGLDQIRDYLADPKREYDGLRHGFLELKVQLFLRGPELVIEPRPSSVTRAATKRPRATARKRTARKPQPTNPAKKIPRKQA